MVQGLAQVFVHVDSGVLRDSVRIEITTNNEQVKTVAVKAGGIDAPYAAIIEAKYPFMAPAFDQVKPEIEDALKQLQGIVDECSKH